jgi:hypothetical protein
MYGDHLPSLSAAADAEGRSRAIEHRHRTDAIVSYLDRAVRLATPAGQRRAVSPAEAKVLASAYTQSALLFYTISKDLAAAGLDRLPEWLTAGSASDSNPESPCYLEWTRTRFEEEASRCFFMAGAYGSEVGKKMAVLTNPYARLCGAIVKEAMRGETTGSR